MNLKKFTLIEILIVCVSALGWTVAVIGFISAYVYFFYGYEMYTGADGREHTRTFYGTIYTGLTLPVGLGIEATSACELFIYVI